MGVTLQDVSPFRQLEMSRKSKKHLGKIKPRALCKLLGPTHTFISVGLSNGVNIKWLAEYCGTSVASPTPLFAPEKRQAGGNFHPKDRILSRTILGMETGLKSSSRP